MFFLETNQIFSAGLFFNKDDITGEESATSPKAENLMIIIFNGFIFCIE